MRRRLAATAGAVVAAAGLAACTPSVTAPRVDDAIGPEFAALYARQQALLGHPLSSAPQASASCTRADRREAPQGAGSDWVCQLVLIAGGPAAAYTYELDVKADGCFKADGPPALVGGQTLVTPSGAGRVNPLFAFDGCFRT